MAQEPRSVTVQLPPDLLDELKRLSIESNRSIEEVVNEAVSRYIHDDDWKKLLNYGESKSTRQGLMPDDVEQLIDEYRSETR